jgi:hypothetical protein
MNEQQRLELQRIKSILSAATGFEDDDQEYIDDARKAVCRLLDEQGSEPVQSLQCAHCHVTIETLNDKVMHTLAEIERLQYEVDAIPAIKEERDALAAEVLEQCRIIAMSAEREDSLRAELTRLKASIALDKMADNARELGLDYEPAPVQDLPFGVGGGLVAIKTLLGRDPCVHANTAIEMIDAILKEHPAAQPAVQEGRDWSLLEATQESLREHMAEIKRLKAAQPAPVQEPVAWMQDSIELYVQDRPSAYYTIPLYTTPPAAQPVPVKTYSGGKPWPVAPKPWVNLTDEEVMQTMSGDWTSQFYFARAIEAKLKEKNHDQ